MAGVNGQPVLVVYGLKRSSVIAFYWATGDILHELLILEDTQPPLSLDRALQLVDALMIREEGNAAVACGE